MNCGWGAPFIGLGKFEFGRAIDDCSKKLKNSNEGRLTFEYECGHDSGSWSGHMGVLVALKKHEIYTLISVKKMICFEFSWTELNGILLK